MLLNALRVLTNLIVCENTLKGLRFVGNELVNILLNSVCLCSVTTSYVFEVLLVEIDAEKIGINGEI